MLRNDFVEKQGLNLGVGFCTGIAGDDETVVQVERLPHGGEDDPGRRDTGQHERLDVARPQKPFEIGPREGADAMLGDDRLLAPRRESRVDLRAFATRRRQDRCP